MGQVVITGGKKRSWVKPTLIGTGVIAGSGLLIWGYTWYKGKKEFGDRILVSQTISKRVTERGLLNAPKTIELTVTPTIKNPTNHQATLTQPYVEIRLLKDDEKPFASSQVSNVAHTIEPLSEKTLDPIVFTVSVADLIRKAGAIVKEALKSKSIGLYTKTFSYLVAGGRRIPIPPTDEKTEIKF